MSLLSLASVAVARDLAASGEPLGKDATLSNIGFAVLGAATGQPAPGGQAGVLPAPQTAGEPAGAAATAAGTVASFAQLLVAQIPSEALVAYTTLLALFSIGGVSYEPGRWGLYAAAIITCAAAVLGSYLGQRVYGFDDTQTAPAPGTGLNPPAVDGPAPNQITAFGKLHLPYLPVLAAVLSMAVYGLTVPGSPLQFAVSGTAFAIISGCLAVGGGVMMSIFAPFLGKGNAAKAFPKQAGSSPLPQSQTEDQTVTASTSGPPALAAPIVTNTPGPDTHDVGPARSSVEDCRPEGPSAAGGCS
jgi:hypothetical protein